MDYPTPDDPKRAPVWQNYVVAQATQAALTIVPPYVHAVGVEVNGYDVALVFQVPEDAPIDDDLDVIDLRDDLEDKLGPSAHVAVEVRRTGARTLDPREPVIWFYASRWD